METTTHDLYLLELTLEREELRLLYMDDLRKEVDYYGKPRPRARKVEAVWNKIEAPTENLINIGDYEDVWVWGDTHFRHANIIKYCDRPFKDVDDMNQRLIANHNKLVKPNDLVIWVGDVAFANDTTANEYLAQMPGDRILIVGNHDVHKKRIKRLDFNEIYSLYTIDDPVCPLVFTHYTMENAPLPWINVHGHVHNKSYYMEDSLQHINVGVEVLDYTPIHLNDLWRIAKTRLESIE